MDREAHGFVHLAWHAMHKLVDGLFGIPQFGELFQLRAAAAPGLEVLHSQPCSLAPCTPRQLPHRGTAPTGGPPRRVARAQHDPLNPAPSTPHTPPLDRQLYCTDAWYERNVTASVAATLHEYFFENAAYWMDPSNFE